MEYPFKDLLPQDEATARDGYYKDWTHIDADTFHQISDLAKFIREKGYGADTREAIAQALERVYHDAAMSGNANMEVSMARKNFKDLASRLNASDDKLTSATTQLAQKITKNRGAVTSSDLSQEVKEQMTGGSVAVVGKNSVLNENIVDGQVSIEKTNFVTTGKNLFDGTFSLGVAPNIIYTAVRKASSDDSFGVLFELEEGEKYTVTKFQGGNRFNVLLLNGDDIYTDTGEPVMNYFEGHPSPKTQSYTFTNDSNAKFIFVYTNSNSTDKPKVQIEKGDISTGYEPYHAKIIDDMGDTFFEKSSKNIFSGAYSDAIVSRNANDYMLLGSGHLDTIGRTAIVEVQKGRSYSISIPDEDNDRFRVSFSKEPIPISGEVSSASNHLMDEVYHDEAKDGIAHELTIGPAEDGFLYVYVSASGHDPRLQIEVGEEVTEYEPYEMISKRYLPSINQIDNQTEAKKSFSFFEIPKGLFFMKLDDVEADPDIRNMHSNDIHELFDGIVTAHSETLSSEVLGVDPEGNQLKAYHHKPAKYQSDVEIKNPKIVITTGVHGDEKTTPISLYNMFYNMYNNWKSYPLLEFFRYNVEFSVIPVVNPSGFNAYTRTNSNNVNINRDFPSKGQVGEGTQSETNLVIDFLNNHSELDIMIDFHNMHQREGRLGYVVGGDEYVSELIPKTIATVSRKWQKEYDFMPDDDNYEFGYSTAPIDGTLGNYAEGFTTAAILEVVRRLPFGELTEYDDYNIKFGAEELVNTIKGMIEYINH